MIDIQGEKRRERGLFVMRRRLYDDDDDEKKSINVDFYIYISHY